MEIANVLSSLCLHETAPTSPNSYDCKSLAYLYCSAPASPRRKKLVDFESSTDELFISGIVMPLKLPPRLQYNSEFNSPSQRLTFVSTSKSPTPLCKIPFARKYTWQDNFDPFTVALEKVREEKRGRSGQPRCSRSYSSPLSTASKYSCTDTISCSQDSYKDKSSMIRVPALSYSGPLERKGSAYARWLQGKKKEGLTLSRPIRNNAVETCFGQLIRPMKNGMDKPASTKGRDAKEKCGNDNEERGVQTLKGLLLKYASFGREKNVAKLTEKSVQAQKGSYFSRLSFKLREKGKRISSHNEMMTVAGY
ncbi:hypothetical protein F511_03067 [Dorcoceras hygrometricum]|nr:hypothetical protein F511_03067 [Dorcoceras hygrometricum]